MNSPCETTAAHLCARPRTARILRPWVLIPAAAVLAVACATIAVPSVAQEAPSAEAAEARQTFEQAFDEWKNILKELRTLKIRYLAARESEFPEIEKEWGQKMKKAERILPKLRDAGVAAFIANPNADRQLTRFLLTLAQDDMDAEKYEQVLEVAGPLADAGSEDPRAFDLAGVAAFRLNQFDSAKKYLDKGAELGGLGRDGQNYYGVVDDYVAFWDREQQLREQEANQELPRVKIVTTRGDIVVELFENEAPETVGNFIHLVEQDFYNNLTFHRVLPHFMAQGGCPVGDGSGGPGYHIYCECRKENHRNHFRGSLSMAHAGPDTGGSQFFLNFVPTPHLNGHHTVFGRVVEGLELLNQIKRFDPSDPDGQPDKIVKAEVVRKDPNKKYAPNKVQ